MIMAILIKIMSIIMIIVKIEEAFLEQSQGKL